MIPAAFDYELAESVEHAISLLGTDPDAKVLAGGHSLLPAMKLRIARPSKLVDIGRLSELAYVRDAGTQLAIGALTRHARGARRSACSRSIARSSRRRRARSATRRCVIAARSVARSPTATLPRISPR